MAGNRRRSHRSRRAAKANKEAEVGENAASCEAALKSVADEKPMMDFEVMAAIESLYQDQLKPFGRILRKRMAERAVERDESSTDNVDIKGLRAACEESELLSVNPEEGGDWSVVIVGRSDSFINIYGAEDVYSEGMWGAAAAYFHLLGEDDMKLPGGRYSCAQMLQARELAFLKGRSLGQICHIVQLAISQRKLLGYLNGSVVPYSFSQSMLKEQCALLRAPCAVAASTSEVTGLADGTIAAENDLTIATWDIARKYLHEILDAAPRQAPADIGSVPLSNIKRIFRTKYQLELSETRLGHSKLSDLLQDERFGDICNVQLKGNGYIVFEVKQQTEPAVEEGEPASNENDLLDSSSSRIDVGTLIHRTFIHASVPPPSPIPNARKRSASLPKDVGSLRGLWKTEGQELGCMSSFTDHAAVEDDDAASTSDSVNFSALDGSEPSHRSTSCAPSVPCQDPVRVMLNDLVQGTRAADEDEPSSRPRAQFCIDEPLELDEASTLQLEPGPLTQTPSGMYTHPSVLKWPSSFHVSNPEIDEDESPPRRFQFCPDEPLDLDAAAITSSVPTFLQTPTPFLSSESFSLGTEPPPQKWPSSPSPSLRDGRIGSISLAKVQNTFIHSPLPPPSPMRTGACRRSRSLPKDLGSEKDVWETTCQSLACSSAPRVAPAASTSDAVTSTVESNSMYTPLIYPDYIASTFVPPVYYGGVLFDSFLEQQAWANQYYNWPTPEPAPSTSNVISLASLLQ